MHWCMPTFLDSQCKRANYTGTYRYMHYHWDHPWFAGYPVSVSTMLVASNNLKLGSSNHFSKMMCTMHHEFTQSGIVSGSSPSCFPFPPCCWPAAASDGTTRCLRSSPPAPAPPEFSRPSTCTPRRSFQHT